MQNLIDTSNIIISDNYIDNICCDIISKTKLINNCIIYDEMDNLVEENLDFNLILKINQDWTGYEVNCNELLFSLQNIPLKFIIYFAETLGIMLNKKYINHIFFIIFSIQEEQLTVRFHTYRENEGMWLRKELNSYNEPILISITSN